MASAPGILTNSGEHVVEKISIFRNYLIMEVRIRRTLDSKKISRYCSIPNGINSTWFDVYVSFSLVLLSCILSCKNSIFVYNIFILLTDHRVTL